LYSRDDTRGNPSSRKSFTWSLRAPIRLYSYDEDSEQKPYNCTLEKYLAINFVATSRSYIWFLTAWNQKPDSSKCVIFREITIKMGFVLFLHGIFLSESYYFQITYGVVWFFRRTLTILLWRGRYNSCLCEAYHITIKYECTSSWSPLTEHYNL